MARRRAISLLSSSTSTKSSTSRSRRVKRAGRVAKVRLGLAPVASGYRAPWPAQDPPGDDHKVPCRPRLLLTFLEGDKIRHAVLPPLVSKLLTRRTPNTSLQPLPKAGVERTLEAVACTPKLARPCVHMYDQMLVAFCTS